MKNVPATPATDERNPASPAEVIHELLRARHLLGQVESILADLDRLRSSQAAVSRIGGDIMEAIEGEIVGRPGATFSDLIGTPIAA